MLSHQWRRPEGETPLPFRLTSLTDRVPVSPEDELVVVACPDPQVCVHRGCSPHSPTLPFARATRNRPIWPHPKGAEECIRLVRMFGEQDEKVGRDYRPVVLFNPRLSRQASFLLAVMLSSCPLCVPSSHDDALM